jgi:uncharacterized membrane protein YdjX (TVP38/TMEM64 family)
MQLIVATVLLCGLLALIAGLWISGHLALIVHELWDIFKNREHLRSYVESWGPWAPAAFVLIQAVQVMIAPIPGELTGAVGGFIFGVGPTIVYSSIGLTIGSIINFTAARIIGLPFIKLVVSDTLMGKFHFLTERRGLVLALVLFLIPGFPKDILSYILGLSPMGLIAFVTVCALGRIPGTVMLSLTGSAVYDRNWALLTFVSVACFIALACAYVWRARIEFWLKGRSEGSP